jgi:hypothetical protein
MENNGIERCNGLGIILIKCRIVFYAVLIQNSNTALETLGREAGWNNYDMNASGEMKKIYETLHIKLVIFVSQQFANKDKGKQRHLQQQCVSIDIQSVCRPCYSLFYIQSAPLE